MGAHCRNSGVEFGPAETEIRRRIADLGQITFAEFMEIALYHRSDGYYSRSKIGTSKDYFTSPAAHPAFGALLAVQAERVWEILGKPKSFHVVEMGAGDGLMARDFVKYANRLSQDFLDALKYVAVDRCRSISSSTRPSSNYHQILSDGVPLSGVTGIFVSNELFDALPVHRFTIRSGRSKEVFVTLDSSGDFVERLGEPSSDLINQRLSEFNGYVPEGFLGEINAGIGPMTSKVSTALVRGFVITVDYGYEASDLYSETRNRGTVRTYFRHIEGADPFQRIGSQDITTHVDFTELASEGERSGLRAVGLMTQAEFMKSLGWARMAESIHRTRLTSYDRDANMMGLMELVKPEGLGGFKVLVQEKCTDIRGLDDLVPLLDRSGGLETPTVSHEHAPLFAAKYPHQDLGLEDLWPFDTDQSDDQRDIPN